jgi:hypothetical protein
MENIEHQTLTTEFYEAWKLAIETVISIALPLSKEKNIHFSLLRDHLNQPFIEHFSFRFGNQIFFCCVHTDEKTGVTPAATDALYKYARECGAVPCVIPITKSDDGTWKPYTPDYPLHFIKDDGDPEPLIFSSIISKDLVEMSDWEILDWAINVVVDHIMDKFGIKHRHEINYQSTTGIYPQIWFKDQNGSVNYVVVSAVRFPKTDASKPDNIEEICGFANKQGQGFFASVSFVRADGFKEYPGLGSSPPAEFIYRGCGANVNFKGLEKL